MIRDPEPGEYRSFKLVDRKAIPKRWKADAYQRELGRCYVCQKPVPPGGPDVQYDHRTPLWLDETAHKAANIFPICTKPCHRDKSASEAPVRAKVLRLMKAKAGVKKDKRPIASRGFDRSMTKGFDGKVRPRKAVRHGMA